MKETDEFGKVLARLLVTHQQLPNKVAATAIAFVNQRFREQAWADNYTKPWKARKADRSRKRANRRRRALLVKTGRLKRSIRKISANSELVEIGTDVEYAQVHNQGFRGVVNIPAHTRHRYNKQKETYTTRTGRQRTRTTRKIDEDTGPINVRAHRRRMNVPRRQYIGVSALLNRQLERMITAEYMKILRNNG